MADEEKADPTEESAAPADDRNDPPSEDVEILEDEVEILEDDIVDEAGDPTPEPESEGQGPEEPEADSRELVGAGAGRRGRERSAARRTGSSPMSSTDLRRKDGKDAKKDKATPRRHPAAPERTRTGPVTFVRESVGELRKVVYPTGQQLINYFFVVLVFVLFVIAFVSLLDLAFGAAIFEVFS